MSSCSATSSSPRWASLPPPEKCRSTCPDGTPRRTNFPSASTGDEAELPDTVTVMPATDMMRVALLIPAAPMTTPEMVAPDTAPAVGGAGAAAAVVDGDAGDGDLSLPQAMVTAAASARVRCSEVLNVIPLLLQPCSVHG